MGYGKREAVDDPIVDRIEQTLQSQNKTKKELMSFLGLKDTNFTNWKYRNSKAYMKYIDRISEYLGVGAQYLLYGTNDTNNALILTAEEKKIITKFRTFDDSKKTAFVNIMAYL